MLVDVFVVVRDGDVSLDERRVRRLHATRVLTGFIMPPILGY
jgi:hypothetical protein